MKVVILAGGFGTRISEESAVRPKPMVEIGGRPILWHIMKIYSHYGINDFVIAVSGMPANSALRSWLVTPMAPPCSSSAASRLGSPQRSSRARRRTGPRSRRAAPGDSR